MMIGLVAMEYPPGRHGGIGTQTSIKARGLARRGHEVHVLCGGGTGPTATTAVEEGVHVHRIDATGNQWPVYNLPTWWLGYSWTVLGALARLTARVKFDVLDFPEYGGEAFAWLLDRTEWNRVPTVLQLHGPLALLAERLGWPAPATDLHKVGLMMEEFCIRRADALMACSANIADFVAGYYPVARESITVVHCGVDAEAFRPRAAGAAEPVRPTVLFVGKVCPTKGVTTVFDAVLRLRAKYPDIRFVIAGGAVDRVRTDMEEAARRADATANIEFLGHLGRAEMPRLYQQAHVFASPADHESGVCNTYLEAMAAGCPLIVANTGGGAEAVRDGETGFQVPPRDVPATAAALDRVLGDAQLRQRLARAARERVDEYFALDRYLDRILAVYAQAIAGAAGKPTTRA